MLGGGRVRLPPDLVIRSATIFFRAPVDQTIALGPAAPAPTISVIERTPALRLRTEIVVIGAGQAGLSSAYHLQRRGLAPVRGFVVLDHAQAPGGAWQFRWPSLTLRTVNRIHDLPGFSFADFVEPGVTEVRAAEAVPRYFAAYERTFGLPVYRPVTVTVVCEPRWATVISAGSVPR